MKQIAYIFFLLILLGSCRYKTGSGNIISETRSTGNFDGISVGGGFDVEVKIGTTTTVMVEADDNIMKYIETTVSGNTLKIRTEDMNNYSDVHMKIFITAPAIKRIKASASAEVDVMDVLAGTDQLTFGASSGANIKAEVDAPQVSADVSSGASINLKGKTKTYSAEASSGAEIRSGELLSENTTVKVSSGASATVHASVSLTANASSGASVTYTGGATVNQSVSSGGSVSKRD
jgi:Putative auto-transporter adhesin, head GIN domain